MSRLSPAKIILFFLLLLPLPAGAGMNVVTGTPEGFEQLEKPRQTMMSLYYGGDLLGSFSAHFTPTTVQFDKPDEVLKTIPNVKDQAKVLSGLQQALPINVDQLCTEKRVENCGVLKPASVGIIFNENTQSGELFINKDYLTLVNKQDEYLPLPERRLSSIYMFNGAVNGTTDGSPTYAVTNNAIASFGEAKLNTQTTMADNGLRFDTVQAGVERKGWMGAGGLFRSRPMQLVGDTDMAGVDISTSTNTLTDMQRTQGNDVVVYLPRRAFVSIYREDRLFSSRAYEAGNQLIDTSALPDGAYTITLKIQEADGATREERRFFAKNQEIPPSGHPIYFTQAGVVRRPASDDNTIPELTSKPLARVGTVRRMGENVGLGVNVTGINDRAAAETGIYWIKSATQLRVTGMASSKSDIGANANLLYTKDRLTAAIDARQVWAGSAPDLEYQNLFANLTQASATAAYAFKPEMTLGWRASYAKQDLSPENLSFGPYMQWRIWQKGENMLEFTANAARTDNRNQGDALLRYTYRFGDYGVTGSGGGNFGPNAGPVGNVRGFYQRIKPGDTLIAGAGVSGDKKNQSVNADAEWRNNFGQFQGSVQQGFGDNGSTLGYGGNFAVNAAATGKNLLVGGNFSDRSAIIVKLNGEAKAAMKVFVNNVHQGTVKVGEKRAIYLSPFRTYRIHLTPEKAGMVDYEANARKVTLYPGNVVDMEWTVNNFYVVVGRVVTPDGQPLADALLSESKAQITTGASGQLQAEISNPHVLNFKHQGGDCAVTLPDDVYPKNGVLIYRDALVCQPVSQTSSQ